MALQNTDFFLVNRAGTGHRLAWSELQSTTEGSLQVQDVFTYTGTTGATTAAQTEVPFIVDQGIRLPVAGTGDYNVDGAIRYSPTNSKLEMYYGGAWNTASGGTAFGSNPPSPATEGDVWYDTDNGRSYVYYNDGTSSQWVEMNPAWDGGTPPDTIGTTELVDESVTPAKLASSGLIDFNSSGFAIGEVVGPQPLTIRHPNQSTLSTLAKLTTALGDGSQDHNTEIQHRSDLAQTRVSISNTDATLDPFLRVDLGSTVNVLSVSGEGTNGRVGIGLGASSATASSALEVNGVLTLSGDSEITSADSSITIQPGGTTGARTLVLKAGRDDDVTGGNIVIGSSVSGEGGHIYFRGNGGSDQYRFSKSGVSTIEGFLNFNSLTADRTYTFPDEGGTIALTTTQVQDSQRLDGLESSQFIRTDQDTDVTAHTEWQDNSQVRLGTGADFRVYHDGADTLIESHNGRIVLDSSAGTNTDDNFLIYRDGVLNAIFSDGCNFYYDGVLKTDTTASGTRFYDSIFPDVDGGYTCGTSSTRWGFGYFDNITVTNVLNVREAIDLADDDFLRFGSSDDVEINYNSNGWLYLDHKENGYIFQDNGVKRLRLHDEGIFRPETTGTGFLGTSTYRWGEVWSDDMRVQETLTVRGAIDLADSDILRFGTGDDVEMFFNGAHMYMDLNAGNFYIRDGTTTRFTFDDNGSFTATGAGTFNDTLKVEAGFIAGNTSVAASRTSISTTGIISSLATYNNAVTSTSNIIRTNTAGQFQRSSSSRRYKDNIRSIDNVGGLDVILNVEPRQWNDHSTGEHVYGLIAEEVHSIGGFLGIEWGPYNPSTPQNDNAPVARHGGVAKEGDEVIEAINDRGMIMHLIEAVKELKAENDALKARLDEAGL